MDMTLTGLNVVLIILWTITSINARFSEGAASSSLTSPSGSNGNEGTGVTVSCACNTQECRSQGMNRCTATNMCYIQTTHSPGRKRLPAGNHRGKRNNYIRGCINRSTPLLCENRPPALLDGEIQWPVLYCCSTPLCNSLDVLPVATLPVWRGQPVVILPVTTTTTSSSTLQLHMTLAEESLPTGEETEAEEEESQDALILSSGTGEERLPDTTLEDSSSAASDDTIPPMLLDDNKPAVFIPATSTSGENELELDSTSLNPLYIIVPVICFVILALVISLGVLVLRRAQYVSTEDLVQRSSRTHRNFQLNLPVCHNINANVHSLNKKSKKIPSTAVPVHTLSPKNLDYITGSALDDYFPPQPDNNYHPYWNTFYPSTGR